MEGRNPLEEQAPLETQPDPIAVWPLTHAVPIPWPFRALARTNTIPIDPALRAPNDGTPLVRRHDVEDSPAAGKSSPSSRPARRMSSATSSSTAASGTSKMRRGVTCRPAPRPRPHAPPGQFGRSRGGTPASPARSTCLRRGAPRRDRQVPISLPARQRAQAGSNTLIASRSTSPSPPWEL